MNFDNKPLDRDIDYVGMYLFQDEPVDPTALIDNEDPRDGLNEAPPPISGYREANVVGMACWNCGHFTATGDDDNDGIPDGICNLFEAKAEGECTCDRFTAHADLFRQSPHTSWAEEMANSAMDMNGQEMGPSVASVDYSESSVLNEIHLSDETATEEEGLVWKDILRTGSWTHTPSNKGIVKKPLQIVRDGNSDPANGIISLSELYQNFNEKAIPYVTVPLSDDDFDHKNIARLNTGFVRKLKLVDRDGDSVLQAGIDFTEPDVKGKVLRGTIPDVSAAVPFGVTRRSDNKTFATVLDHVCLTRKPFVDRLMPFGIAAADGEEELPVEAWEQAESPRNPRPSQETPPPSSENGSSLSFRQYEAEIHTALENQLRLSREYQVLDVRGKIAVITHSTSNAKWEVPFRMTDDHKIVLASIENWKLIEEENPSPEPIAASNKMDDLQRARELRELRLAQPTSQTGGIEMSTLSLEGVELSDEARSRIQSILSENEDLRKQTRQTEVDSRITELEGFGLKDRPGALKFYRQVMLSDDGGPAVVLFSDADENKKERLTALEVLDRFIDGLKADGGVVFSDQHFESGNDNKPPTTPDGELKPLEERVEEQKEALYGKHNRRK